MFMKSRLNLNCFKGVLLAESVEQSAAEAHCFLSKKKAYQACFYLPLYVPFQPKKFTLCMIMRGLSHHTKPAPVIQDPLCSTLFSNSFCPPPKVFFLLIESSQKPIRFECHIPLNDPTRESIVSEAFIRSTSRRKKKGKTKSRAQQVTPPQIRL